MVSQDKEQIMQSVSLTANMRQRALLDLPLQATGVVEVVMIPIPIRHQAAFRISSLGR